MHLYIMCCGLSLVVLPERVCCHDDPQGNRWALPRQLANGAMSSSERTRRAWGPCQGVKTQQEWDHTGARTMLPPWVVALGLAPSCGGRCFCWQAALCVWCPGTPHPTPRADLLGSCLCLQHVCVPGWDESALCTEGPHRRQPLQDSAETLSISRHI